MLTVVKVGGGLGRGAGEDALGGRPLSVLTTAGELVSPAEARARPWDVAAANWVATALAVADAPAPWGATGGEVAPAAALAALLASRLPAPC